MRCSVLWEIGFQMLCVVQIVSPTQSLIERLQNPLQLWGIKFNIVTTGTSCQSSLITTPACADPSWVLWQGAMDDNISNYFCCSEGQIGLVDRECVSGQQNVAASIEASLVSYPLTPTRIQHLFSSFLLSISNNRHNHSSVPVHPIPTQRKLRSLLRLRPRLPRMAGRQQRQ
jgi:hypothetical protein